MIALCDEKMYNISKPAQIANAKAIAAVPDLIEALADLVDKCAAVVDGFSPESSPHNYTSILNDNLLCIQQSMGDAEAALTKAGETL